MSNPESFIDEVTEEVRRDRLFAIFRKYGWIAVVLVILIVGAASWREWQAAQHRAESQAFGDAVLNALDQGDPASRAAALDGIEATGGRAAVLELLRASDPETGKAEAIAALDALIADTSLPPSYHDLAVLKRVILADEDMSVSERRAALDPISAPGRPYRTLAREQLAYLDLEAGERDRAIETLRELTTDQEAPAGLRQRASQVIVALGGVTEQG